MVFLIVLALVVGCGSSKEDQARKLQQSKESWETTADLTNDLRQRGTVPEVYARQTLDAVRQELKKVRWKAEQLSR